MLEKIQIVWFKRDLRVEDNTALVSAVASNTPIIPLYILEPDLWKQPDMSYRQYQFLNESLIELNQNLSKLGQSLIVRIGNAVEVLESFNQQFKIKALWSHQETWNDWTYKRDKHVLAWTKSLDITWHEPVQNGVIRKLKDRNGWAAKWYTTMKQPLLSPPEALQFIDIVSEKLPKAEALTLQDNGCIARQSGGRSEGLKLLNSFFCHRGKDYTKQMSSPVTAYQSCSRLSAHIAFGTLSIREIFQTMQKRQVELSLYPTTETVKWNSAIRSFSARLRWHCHFIQKLEDKSSIEFENLHTAYNSLRKNDINIDHFKAWKEGKTGYPMIDACMRALKATGWINFRMRAMLMSFASYHLWLPWQKPALYLANLFVDYEPGIHYSQVQMQSGTMGINAIRIYNPIKQSLDHDPNGNFIKQWIPELLHMPVEQIHTPWEVSTRMNGYPMPIVDEKIARITATKKIYALQKDPHYKTEARAILIKHGSRKRIYKRISNRSKTNLYVQLELPF